MVIFCAISLAASIIVMYVHNRSCSDEASLTMPTWVGLRLSSLLLFSFYASAHKLTMHFYIITSVRDVTVWI